MLDEAINCCSIIILLLILHVLIVLLAGLMKLSYHWTEPCGISTELDCEIAKCKLQTALKISIAIYFPQITEIFMAEGLAGGNALF